MFQLEHYLDLAEPCASIFDVPVFSAPMFHVKHLAFSALSLLPSRERGNIWRESSRLPIKKVGLGRQLRP